MIYNLIGVPTSQLSRLASSRPIHTLITITVLATIVYLSIIDEYVSRAQFNAASVPSYYHPAGNSDYKQWTRIEDSESLKNSNAERLAIIPLKFKTTFTTAIPEIENSFTGLTPSEKFVITPLSNYEQEVANLAEIASSGDNISWTIKHSHRTSKYSEHFKNLLTSLHTSISGAQSYDIILIVLAYSAMWYTFVQVFVEFRKIGSHFWLAFGSILSSGYAFLFALGFTNNVLGLKISLKTLSEGIPFIVAIIGFNHKVYFTKPILRTLTANKKKSVQEIISDTVKLTAWPLCRYHLIVIAAFTACTVYAPHLEGLRNFCILSASILVLDLVLTFTFYSAVLALKSEINKVHASLDLKEFLEEDGISTSVAELVSEDQQSLLFHKNNGVVSLKIAIIVAFFAIHFFALGTSWLHDSADNSSSVVIPGTTSGLSKQAAKYIKIGKKGTIVTVMPTEIFMPTGFVTQVEDFVYTVFTMISNAIKDPLLSKVLLFITALSITINVYLLNAARFHFNNIDTLTTPTSQSPVPKVEQKTSKKKTKKPEIVLPPNKEVNNGSAVKEAQLTEADSTSSSDEDIIDITKQRPLEELIPILKAGNAKQLNNNEVTRLVLDGKLPLYALEKQLGDTTRAVVVRRKAIAKLSDSPIVDSDKLPYKFYDYDRVFGACCENVIGFIPIPLGVAGPLIIDGKPYHIPMATTEGCLVASAMRGCKAINAGGGVSTVLTQDGMTRGPCVSFPSLARSGACKMWLDSEEGSAIVKKAFNSTSRFARLQSIKTAMAGTLLYVRFMTTTGDAMGMNMISKGVDYALNYMIEECGWDDMEIISVSGNYCIDKKPAALNWIEGRGKSVVAEARIPATVVEKVLKSNVRSLVRCNTNKNLIGSAMAGAMGGFNAQAANLVTAIYLATGQDPAQNVESSNCITLLDEADNGDLVISVSMPSIEVGTIGGGTILAPQNAMLELLGVKGANVENPGANAKQLAKIVASAVLSAELSLLSALEAGHLVASHMQHNRKSTPAVAPASAPAAISSKPIPGSCIKS